MKTLIAEFENFKWFDVMDPKMAELTELSTEFHIPLALLRDCLDPVKLPKLERVTGIEFYVFRVFDMRSDTEADTIYNLTRKIAVFLGPDYILTVHRLPQKEISQFSDKCLNFALDIGAQKLTKTMILAKLFEEGMRSYFFPLDSIENELELFETELFNKNFGPESFVSLHHIRRKLSLFKRLLMHSQDLVIRTNAISDAEKIPIEDLKETLHHLIFFSDELQDDTTNLLALQISLASQKTNEVVRLLTIFSVFFMPLTFIVGIFGMNFKYMPELEWEYGYHASWVLMIIVTIGLFIWFQRKGWIGDKSR